MGTWKWPNSNIVKIISLLKSYISFPKGVIKQHAFFGGGEYKNVLFLKLL